MISIGGIFYEEKRLGRGSALLTLPGAPRQLVFDVDESEGSPVVLMRAEESGRPAGLYVFLERKGALN